MAAQSEVRKRALLKLGVGARAQNPTSDQTDDMTNAYNEIYERLSEKKLAFWAQTGTIPDKVANQVAALMAFERVNDYGISNERYQRVAVEASRAEPMIRMHAVPTYESSEYPEDF